MSTFYATTARGLESALTEELTTLGLSPVIGRGGVSFEGSIEAGYRACLHSRIASRVLLQLATFPAATPEELYTGVRTVKWSDHMRADQTFAVDFTTSRSLITHTHFGALKSKDAIVDQFRDAIGTRPNVSTERPNIQVNVHVHEDVASLSLDLAGEPLHRRGYRDEGTAAPLKENLAAGLLQLAGWPKKAAEGIALVDPMCGSGTFLIEAALWMINRAPGRRRAYFGFLGWKQHDAVMWARLLAEADAAEKKGPFPPIQGSDIDRLTVRAAQSNARMAGVNDLMKITQGPMADVKQPEGLRDASPKLMFITNPPYGERLGEERQLSATYFELGNLLRDRFENCDAWVLSGNPALARDLGLKPSKVYPVFNGPIACEFLNYPILAKLNRAAPTLGPAGLPWGAAPRAEAFANRLTKNLKHLGKWARREGVTCYRAYDKDLPEYAVAVDVYEGFIHVQEYAAPATVEAVKAERRLRDLLATIPTVCGVTPDKIFLKTRERQKGHGQYEKLGGAGDFHVIHENGHQFRVNFTDYLDTGLFLDHRPTRKLVGEMAKGKSFLNLFCYTATASVYAIAGGAKSSVSVDMSNTYLDWAWENYKLNDIGAGHEFVREDAMAFLKEETSQYDLIFLDPPTYSRSKRMDDDFDIQRDHVELLKLTTARLAPGGTLVFSNNFRRFKLDTHQLAGLRCEDITAKTIPPDFERNHRIHQTYLITHREGA